MVSGRTRNRTTRRCGSCGYAGHHAAMLADSLVKHGFSAVVDDVIIGSRVDEMCAAVCTRPLFLFMLTPGLDVVARRDDSRPGWKRAGSR
ncbi:MAG TPA: hypothetical protein VFI65_04600 [Streptosporangiaceae bacterium]|nr:hypothetical protein [Streptosporangiaceae bacterium]